VGKSGLVVAEMGDDAVDSVHVVGVLGELREWELGVAWE
jgi:hypothetical protein